MAKKLEIGNCTVYKSDNYVVAEIEDYNHQLDLVELVNELITKGYSVVSASKMEVYLSK